MAEYLKLDNNTAADVNNRQAINYSDLVSADVAAEGIGLWTRMELVAATNELEEMQSKYDQSS